MILLNMAEKPAAVRKTHLPDSLITLVKVIAMHSGDATQ